MTKFSVPDMTCGHCKATIETALKELDANAAIDVDLENHVVSVEAAAEAAALLAAIKDAGYTPSQLS